MKIRPLISKDRLKLRRMVIETGVFTDEEVSVAMELIDIVIGDKNQKDYQIVCAVDGQDEPIGYVCYGPVPMTRGAFDLYWIVIDPKIQGQKIGSELLNYMEEEVRGLKGRMILADTSSIPSYEKANGFYLKREFKEVARIADYYWEGNDRITYCKKIS
ncbi:MAG: GNAT family N-acetyltransferase [Deltaproteobacteria bacterium]|nr:GNAT family N-acetyltransferase [Deltaproteobacteria bacterium]MBM4324012.1 GNAT family N-acetyltransferase [Deltaproteobacteria bacterium]